MKNICIVGMGKMGKSIYKILRRKKINKIHGITRKDDKNEALKKAEIILIAVKPQDFSDFCKKIEVNLSEKLIISIMAGISIEKIAQKLKAKKIVRVMPNLALKYGIGFSGWYATKDMKKREQKEVKEILRALGKELKVDKENKINEITALSGCGLAYYYLLHDAMCKKAIKYGFSKKEAKQITDATFLGSAKLFEKEGVESIELIKMIASKKGTTASALNELKKNNFKKIIWGAMDKSKKRAIELNN